jgi:serine/threonine-protein phosphatase 2A regulatory subunit B''
MSWVEALKQYNETHGGGGGSSISPSPAPVSTPSPTAASTSNSSGGAEEVPQVDAAKAAAKEQAVLNELRAIYRTEAAKRAQQRAEQRASRAKAKAASTEPAPALSAQIPRFYIKRTTSPPPADPAPDASSAEEEGGQPPAQSLATQLRREARTRYLIARAEQLLDDREISILWETIQLHSVDTNPTTGAVQSGSPSTSPVPSSTASGSTSIFDSEKRLNYDAFLLVSHSLPASKSSRYFKPSTFLSFPQDSHGRISSRALWRYVTKKVQLTRLRISLTCYDDIGYGYLREQDLENYVYDQLATLPPLQSLERDFYPYYVFTAVRKFIFFLDPHRRGKLRIKSIVESAVMGEFDALRYPQGHHHGTKKNSWFSAQHTQDVYAIYLGLDSNQNGMLSREEFRAYNGGNLTNIFIEGLFAEYRMYPSSSSGGSGGSSFPDEEQQDQEDQGKSGGGGGGGLHELEMDYKTFLDFVLAMEYKTTPASIAYFFKILDIQHRGYLDSFTLNYWFRAVSEKMGQLGLENAEIADVVANEIFDMVSPSVEGRITLADLISSRCGHTVISILIDVNGFWKYDNRESLLGGREEEEEN